MRSFTRYSTALLLSVAVGACGGNKDTAGSTEGAAGGEAAAASGSSAGSTAGAAVDSAGSAVAGAAKGAAGAVAGAAGAVAGGAANLAGMSAGDQLAVIGASNATEIATSKAAQPKLTNAEARSYARDMIREHQTMQGQADKLAKAASLTPGTPELATQKTQMANQMAEQLGSATKGAALDRQYIDGQVQAHQQTLEQLQGLQNASDSTVKSLATQALPKVQAHLERAQRIQKGLGGGAGDSAAAGGAAGAGASGAAAGGTSGAQH
jgi:putative membrane protein